MRRSLLGGLLLVAIVAVLLLTAPAWVGRLVASVEGLIAETRPPIVVGLVHSQTGPLAISEKSLIEAEVLALEEINAGGGLAGRLVRWEIADGRSDPSTFASQSARLIEEGKADVLVGSWTAECRKAMLAVVEAHEGLMIFPANYEGIEGSSNIVYAGGCANQVILPSVRWCLDALKAKKFYLVGTEELWSKVVSEIAKDGIKAGGGELVGESFQPLIGGDADALVEAIRAAKPDVVLDMIMGDFNVSFFSAFSSASRKAGQASDKLPVVAFNLSEDELRRYPPGDVAGHYAGWNYFQSLDRPANAGFVRRFKARYGDARAVSDAMVAAYNGLKLWAQAVREAETGDPRVVRRSLGRQSLDAPEGIITIDPDSRVTWRPFYLGKVRADGQFDVVWSIPKPIQPVVYPATRSKARWLALLDELKARWGGRWSSSEMAHPNPTRPAK